MLYVLLLLVLFLQLVLQLLDGVAIEGALGDLAVLQTASIEAGLVVVVAVADDLAAANDDGAMAVVERRLGSLLEAERQIIVGLHVDC